MQMSQNKHLFILLSLLNEYYIIHIFYLTQGKSSRPKSYGKFCGGCE